jgi:hypothetical protein
MGTTSNSGGKRHYLKGKDGKFAGSVPTRSSVSNAPKIPSKTAQTSSSEVVKSPKEVSIAYANYILSLSPSKQQDAIRDIENPFILHETAKRTEDPDLRAEIASNPHAKSFTLMYLVNRDDTPAVREAIINNPNCDEAVITKWFRGARKKEQSEVLTPGHVNYDKVPGHVLSKIVKRQMGFSAAPDDPYQKATMAGLAAHPNTPANTLRAVTRSYPVRYGRELISNPNLPDDARNSIIRTNRWEHKFN